MLNFLIRVKSTEQEFTSIIPLVSHLLAVGHGQVNIIVDEGFYVDKVWLPENCFVHELPIKKQKSLFGLHHFAANLHEVFNVDYYFDFISDFNSAFIGLAFKSKVRVGLNGGPKGYMYNHTLEAFSGMFLDEQKMSVLKHVKEVDIESLPFLTAEIPKEYEKCCIDLNDIKQDGFTEKVLNIAQCFDEIRVFGYLPVHEQEDVDLSSLTNKVELFSEHEEDILEKLESFQIFITTSIVKAQFALLRGVQSFVILPKESDLPMWTRMLSQVGILRFEGAELVKFGINEEKELRIPSEFEDYLLNYYDLRLEPS